MQKKTSPVDAGLILNDAFTHGIGNNKNLSTTTSDFKQQCGSKNPPHANEVDNRDPITHIYAGNDSLIRCAEAYYWTPDGFPVAAMALPPNRSPYEFDWPVDNRIVVILTTGDHDYTVYQLGHALILCGAIEVIGTVNNETVKWKQSVEQGIAA